MTLVQLFMPWPLILLHFLLCPCIWLSPWSDPMPLIMSLAQVLSQNFPKSQVQPMCQAWERVPFPLSVKASSSFLCLILPQNHTQPLRILQCQTLSVFLPSCQRSLLCISLNFSSFSNLRILEDPPQHTHTQLLGVPPSNYFWFPLSVEKGKKKSNFRWKYCGTSAISTTGSYFPLQHTPIVWFN